MLDTVILSNSGPVISCMQCGRPLMRITTGLPLCSQCKGKRGFTLLEVLIALTILGIIAWSFNSMLIASFKITNYNKSNGKYSLYWCSGTQQCPGTPLSCIREELQSNGANKETVQSCSLIRPCLFSGGVWTRNNTTCDLGILIK